MCGTTSLDALIERRGLNHMPIPEYDTQENKKAGILLSILPTHEIPGMEIFYYLTLGGRPRSDRRCLLSDWARARESFGGPQEERRWGLAVRAKNEKEMVRATKLQGRKGQVPGGVLSTSARQGKGERQIEKWFLTYWVGSSTVSPGQTVRSHPTR